MEKKSNNSTLKRILAIIIFLIIVSFINNKDSDKKEKTYNTTSYNRTKNYNTTINNSNYTNNIGGTNDITTEMEKRGTVFCIGEYFSITETVNLNLTQQGNNSSELKNVVFDAFSGVFNSCVKELRRKDFYYKQPTNTKYKNGQIAFCLGFEEGGRYLAQSTYYYFQTQGWDTSAYNPNENRDEYYNFCLNNKLWEIIIPPESSSSNQQNVKNTKTCNIKGNISYKGQEKIYHMPGCSHYNDTVINREYGERYFCSEQEARNAGRRKCIDY